MLKSKLVWKLIVISCIVAVGIISAGSVIAHLKRFSYHPVTRVYYIAAEKVDWDYAPGGTDKMTGQPVPLPWGARTAYQKVRYIGYTDASFSHKTVQPEWLGILGPIIRGVPGDTIKIVFKNKADQPYSMHPHGVQYDKDSEGSVTEMDDEASEATALTGQTASTEAAEEMAASMDGAGARVLPGHSFTYVWHVRANAGPSPGQGSSRVWLYHSHVAADDIYAGLVGAIVITDPAHARPDATPDDVDHEFVSLFTIFDETQPDMDPTAQEAATIHTINGRFFDNLPGYVMKQGDKVRWYELGLGNEADVHTAHWHGNLVTENGRTTDVVDLLPATMKTVDMVPDTPGTWAYHCHVVDHMEAGMMAMYTVLPNPGR